ncbi:MAG: hypothetical protein WD770_10845 [Actinomycetota bacterium]
MSDLSPKERARIPRKKFGLPERAQSKDAKKETGNYPMPDRTHAASAKGRAKAQLKRGNLTKTKYEQIVRKADKVIGKD